MMEFIHLSQLPFVSMSYEFVGAEHGATGASFFLVKAGPGDAVRLHRHNYDEIVYVISGRATWMVNHVKREAGAGDVLVVKAGEAHRFVSADDDPVCSIDIHLSPNFETEWLE